MQTFENLPFFSDVHGGENDAVHLCVVEQVEGMETDGVLFSSRRNQSEFGAPAFARIGEHFISECRGNQLLAWSEQVEHRSVLPKLGRISEHILISSRRFENAPVHVDNSHSRIRK